MSVSPHSDPSNTRPARHRGTPARVAGVYLVFSLAWIWLSDLSLIWLGIQGESGFWASVWKGSAFVVVSAGVLYWLIRREVRHLTHALGLLRAVADGTTDAVFVKDRAGKYLLFNEAAARFVGKPVEDVLGKGDTEVFESSSAALVRASDLTVMESGRAETQQQSLTAAGVARTYMTTKAPYRDAAGTVIGVMGIARDISDRERAESDRLAHLRFFESMDRVNRALHATNDLERMMSDVLDVVLSELDCDRAWLLYPCDPGAPVWTVPMERTRPEYPGAGTGALELPITPDAVRVFAAVGGTGGPVRFGPGAQHPLPAEAAGQFGVLSQLAMAIHPLTGKPWVFGAHQCSHPRVWSPADERLFQEIGRRLADALTSLLAYRNLRTSEERLRAAMVGSLDAVYFLTAVRDRDGRVTDFTFTDVNPKGEALVALARAAIVGQRLCELLPVNRTGGFFDKYARVVETRTPLEEEFPISAAGIAAGWLHHQVVPLGDGIVITSRDVTARKRMEAHYQQAQKMEAVGRLAGGIAHDFNNLLTIINGFTELTLRGMPPTSPHRDALGHVRGAGERAARLTKQLLAYSRKAMIEPKVLDLNELVDESAKMLRRLIGEDVVIATVFRPGGARIRADRGHIEQVLLNLVLNARDAMPTGGRVTIETGVVALGAKQLPDDPDLKPGRYVRLTVTDTGSGMTAEVRANIFEPFFTTKGVGQGTGLGLAVVQGAVKQSGGHIDVSSTLGVGTTFTLLFPSVIEPANLGSDAPESAARGTETVLLVEDEDAVRAIAQLSLEAFGYTVVAVCSGADAVRAADEHAGAIDLLVTDVMMPEMGGRELAEALRRREPGLRVLFMSGYTDDVMLRHGVTGSADAFLQKPFTPQALAHMVREMLDRGE